jgi:predicted metallo-beta-lactamase superfamily hydrolase
MATHVEAGDVKIVIDPAVALAPSRFGLPPHPTEELAREALWKGVKEQVLKSDVVVITHYHYDHVDPKEPEIFQGKRVIPKHPKRMINRSQRDRAASLLQSLKMFTAEIEYADGKSFSHGMADIRFSKPVPHGRDARRGYVVEVSVVADETFLFTSDVQGPLLEEHLSFIFLEKPEMIFVDGPTTYIDSPHLQTELKEVNENLLRIIREGDISRLVIDHHLTRAIDYKQSIEPAKKEAEEVGVVVECAAEYMGLEPNLLEARRQELYQSERGAYDV